MKLTQQNYKQQRGNIDWARFPKQLLGEPKTLVDDCADNGWKDVLPEEQEIIDRFFTFANKLISKDTTLVKGTSTYKGDDIDPSKIDFKPGDKESAERWAASPARKAIEKAASKAARSSKPVSKAPVKKAAAPKEAASKPKPAPVELPPAKQVDHIPTGTVFIKRYVSLHSKVKSREQVLALAHGLNKAITEQRITRLHPAIKEIERMQEELVKMCNTMGAQAKIEIAEPSLSHYRDIARGEEVRASVRLLKQFIQVSGKAPDKKKAELLGRKLAVAYETIPHTDNYRADLAKAARCMADYVDGKHKTILTPEAQLHGIGSIAMGGMNGLGSLTTGENALLHVLAQSGIKNLTLPSLNRAFKGCAAPGLCVDLAKIIIRREKITSIDGLRAHFQAGRKGTRQGISGVGRITEADVLEVRLSGVGEGAGIGNAEAAGRNHDLPHRTITPPVANGQKPRPAMAVAAKPATQSSSGRTISARDLARMHFKTIGYHGKYKSVIGDPAVGFKMMVYGKPFQGKSSMVIELCKELATLGRGNIAYLALEEGISMSMQKKIVDRGAANVSGLDFIDYLPDSFTGYGFVVIDSVSDRGMSREKLRELFLKNPGVCFISIFHATKDGDARGGLDFAHDMDIILEVDKHEPIVKKNRFL
jgi:hypothetical protein